VLNNVPLFGPPCIYKHSNNNDCTAGCTHDVAFWDRRQETFKRKSIFCYHFVFWNKAVYINIQLFTPCVVQRKAIPLIVGNNLCECRSIFPNSLTSMQIPKKRLCASATQTSTSRSLRCYTTLRNLRQIFWVHVGLTLLSSRMGRSPGASNMGDQRSAEANINLIHRNNGSNTKMTLKPYSAFSQAVNQSSSVPLPPDVSGHRSPFRQPLFRQSIV